MKFFIYVVFFLIAIDSLYAKDMPKLVWPSPPDEAKVEYVSSVRSAKDIGIEKGFFAKAFTFLFGEEEPVLSAPFGIYADKNRVYTTDIATRAVYIFDKKESKKTTIMGSKKEKFLYPIDVVSDAKGNIFVSDSVRAKIYVFEEDGDFSYEIKNKLFQRPVGIAISPDNKQLYVVDAVASQIHVNTLSGKYIKSIGVRGSAAGQFNKPTFIDIGNNGRLYVSDSMNHRVQILDADGKFVNSFGQLGQEVGSFGSPRGIALDSEENIYVTDTMYNTVQIFNQQGQLLMVMGRYGKDRGEFALCEDISIASDNTIYITDVNNRRFQVFKRLNSSTTRSSK